MFECERSAQKQDKRGQKLRNITGISVMNRQLKGTQAISSCG